MLSLAATATFANGVSRIVSAQEYFLRSELTMERYFSRELAVRSGDSSDLRGDIYEYSTRSPFKAFIFSLAVTGAGQYYTGSKIKAGSFLAVDVLLWSGYLIYHSKGASKERDYKAYADQHYIASDYFWWWDQLTQAQQDSFSHRIYQDAEGSPIKSHEYYENIGKYDQFQVGWDDVGLNHPPPEQFYSAHRDAYLAMRKKSNDYFSNATTLAMVSIANHIVSAFDAAIGARRFNKGAKQYSMQFETRNINGQLAPFLVLAAKF